MTQAKLHKHEIYTCLPNLSVATLCMIFSPGGALKNHIRQHGAAGQRNDKAPDFDKMHSIKRVFSTVLFQ